MAIDISFEDYVAPAKAPSEYVSVIESLIKAGPDKVATATFSTEEDAKSFLRALQSAAREIGKSAVKRSLTGTDKDGYKIAVGVRDKITRNRTTEK